MKKNSKNNSFKDFYNFFAKEPSINEKAWEIIHDFYHLVLTTMENNNITKADLARRLNKSRAAVSQMFNKNTNVSVKKMVEIADAVGLDIGIVSVAHTEQVTEKITFSSVSQNTDIDHQIDVGGDDFRLIMPNQENEIFKFGSASEQKYAEA